jgi:putative phosphoesterase
MTRIGVISDTHGYINPKLLNFLHEVDEIWHAGDIGSLETINQLKKLKPVRAVYGNIDGQEIRKSYPEVQCFTIEDKKVLMIHIGGYPNRYDKKAKNLIEKEKPDIFISGHSHILKVMFDEKYNLLHLNPGAAGKSGLHQKITALRFIIDKKEVRDLEVMEIDR